MELYYYHNPKVNADRIGSRPILVTEQGGKIAIDEWLFRLWQISDGRTVQDILQDNAFRKEKIQNIKAALCCLTEAGALIQSSAKLKSVHYNLFSKERDFTISCSPFTTNHTFKLPVIKADDKKSVSVIIVTYNSRQWIENCINSLCLQTCLPNEIIIVDNASEDDSVDFINHWFPFVKLIPLEKKVSYAAAINIGVNTANGAYFLILNPDVYLQNNAISEMLTIAERDSNVAAVAAKLKFLWAPSFLNGIGNRIGAFSWGTDNALGHLDLGQFDNWVEVPSVCFAAALIARHAWITVGALDEHYPLYYEDSDWSYRARLLGFHLLAAPKAVVFHAYGSQFPDSVHAKISPIKLSNVVYGKYRFIQKITNTKRHRFMIRYILVDFINLTNLVLKRDFVSIRAYLYGWKQFIKDLGEINSLRLKIQSERKLDDVSLFKIQSTMPMPYIWKGLPELTRDIISRGYLPLILSNITRPMPEFVPDKKQHSLVIVSHDIVDEKMAGPGMRYWEMARALKQELKVTLAIPNSTSLHDSDIQIAIYNESIPETLQKIVEANDVALISGYMVEKYPFLKTTSTRLLVDLYTPMVLENFHYYLNEPIDIQIAANRHGVEVMNKLVQIGDFFICGNERQRDFWLGVLTANGRVNPMTYAADSKLYKLIDIVGIGLSSQPPRHETNILRGVHPNIPQDAKIVLWGGGIWNWLDPLTLIEAWPKVIKKFNQARLVFLGTHHPNPTVPAHEMALKTIQKAKQIGELDRSIIFLEWVSYKDRESLLCEADVGVTLHKLHAETRFSIRTRVLDYIWAEIPIVITEGDVTSEWVKKYGIGAVTTEADPNDVAQALIEVLKQPKESYRARFDPLKKEFAWEKVVQPVLYYCNKGEIAPDRKNRNVNSISPFQIKLARLKMLFYQVWAIWKNQGMKYLFHRLWRYIQWKWSQP